MGGKNGVQGQMGSPGKGRTSKHFAGVNVTVKCSLRTTYQVAHDACHVRNDLEKDAIGDLALLPPAIGATQPQRCKNMEIIYT